LTQYAYDQANKPAFSIGANCHRWYNDAMKKVAIHDAKNIITRYLSRYINLYPSNDVKISLLDLINDLTSEAESIWDYNSVRYETVMTGKEWKKFACHKQRKPYKSKIFPEKSFFEKRRYYLEILKASFTFYKNIGNSAYKDKLKNALSGLLGCFINAYYEVKLIRFFDLYMGRSSSDRDNGKVNPTKIARTKLEYAINEYAFLTGRNTPDLRRKILSICDGRINVLFDYYATCQIEEDFRTDLKEILKNLQRDYTLDFFDLKIGWEIWKLIHWIGLDVEMFLELSDFPKYKQVEKKLLDFMKNERYVLEILEHMKDELPDCYEKYKNTGCVTSDEIIHEESVRKGYPKKLPSMRDIHLTINYSKKEVFRYFPLAKKGSPRNMILNPVHPESTDRAFQSSTKNILGERVNVIVMTPRSEARDTYIATLAHETTHLMHRILLEMGEKKGVLPKGSAELVPANIMEYFSQLVEEQFTRTVKLPYTKKYEGKEFTDFKSATTLRFQVPYTLVQLGIRKKFDEYLRAGYKTLSEDMLYDIKLEFDRKARAWASTGINVDYERLSAFKIFKSNDPEDGLVYMKKYIEQESQSRSKNGTKVVEMSKAFRKRFGRKWIKSKDARAILLWLLLESGRNYKSEKYGDLVMKMDVTKCVKELQNIGVEQSKI